MRLPAYLVSFVGLLAMHSLLPVTIVVAPDSARADAAPTKADGDATAANAPTPQRMLDLFGVDDSLLRMFVDDVALGSDDEETLTAILYQMPRFPLHFLERWADENANHSPWMDQPSRHRGDALRVAGRAKFVERRPIPRESAERFDFDHYFVVAIEPDAARERSLDVPPDGPSSRERDGASDALASNSPIEPVTAEEVRDGHVARGEGRWLVCTREVPNAWPVGTPIDEPAAAHGLFLKTGATHRGLTDVVLAAPRVAWYPDQADPARGIHADHVKLAALGFDVGLLDDLSAVQRQPIRGEDRECFYQLLAAVARADRQQLAGPVCRGVDFAPLLQQPIEHLGRLLTIEGTARRVTKVFVTEADVRERFGIDHYYQIDIFVPLDRLSIRLGESVDGDEQPSFNNTYPATVCVLQLPPGLSAADDLRQDLRVNAAYFKLWAYRTEYMATFDNRQLQMGPLLMGLEPVIIEQPTSTISQVGVVAGVAVVLALAAAWLGLWRAGRNDDRFDRTVVRRQFEPRDGKSLNGADIQQRPEPDFRHLD